MADEQMPWFPCYPRKWLVAISGMPPHQGYLYWIVCLRIYDVGGPCPDNVQALARRSGLNKRQVAEALDALFRDGKLVQTDAGITNCFAEDVLSKMASHREKLVKAGRAGAFAMHEKKKSNQGEMFGEAMASPPPGHGKLRVRERKKEREEPEADASGALVEVNSTQAELERQLYARGKQVLGKNAGGMISTLLKAKQWDVAIARSIIEAAATKQDPREYVAGAIRSGDGLRTANGGGHGSVPARKMSFFDLERGNFGGGGG